MLSFNSYPNPQQNHNMNNNNNNNNNNNPSGNHSLPGGGNPHNNMNNRGKETFEPNKTLFLGDLSYFCTEDDIFQLLSHYGPISTIRVQRGVSGEPLLHGYIVFHSPASARQALLEVDGIAFMGRNLRVQMGTINHHNKEKLGFSDSKNFTQIHVSFICKRGRGFVVNEQVLRDIFTPFGQIADVAIKKHSRNPKQQRQTGYGFIYFVNAEDACRAVIALKNTTLHDITFDCNISHKSEHMIRSMLEPSLPAAPPASVVPGSAYSQYSTMPPANNAYHTSSGMGMGGGFGSNFGAAPSNANFTRYGYPPRDETDYNNSRVLGGRGHAYRGGGMGQFGVGSEDMLSLTSSGVPSLVENSLYLEDFQGKAAYKIPQEPSLSSTSSSNVLPTLDPFYVDPYTGTAGIGVDAYSSGGVAFPQTASSLNGDSPFEFGRDLAQFDQKILNINDINVSTVVAPIPLSATSTNSTATVGIPSAPTPSGYFNSQQSLATLTSLTTTDGVTTNSSSSPKERPLHDGIKSLSPDAIVNDALLYSFQSLSIPPTVAAEKVEELLKETLEKTLEN